MPAEDVFRLKIDNYSVGIIGLRNIMEEMASVYSEKNDDEITIELLDRVSLKNFIPDNAKKSYGKALVCEFRKFLGQTCETEPSGELEIRVLGQGCTQCDQLEKDVMAVLNEMNIAADLEHVRDLKEIGQYGVMGMPALLINGRIVSVGKVPSKNKIREWLANPD